MRVEEAAGFLARSGMLPGLGLIFIVFSGVIAAIAVTGEPRAAIIVAATAIGAYMALNIGANDVANNVGPAVGSRAMTITTALIIAAIFESAGALIAGGDVVGTISKGIIDPAAVSDPNVFILAMMAALMSSAIWINLATFLGAPVSTTHSIVGGVMGAGIAAAGFTSVNWPVLSGIVASWVISPLLGGIIAAAFLAFIKTFIIYREDKIAAARKWVPILIAVMAGAFSAYLAVKGLKKIIHLPSIGVVAVGLAGLIGGYLITKPLIARQSRDMPNRNQSLRELFQLPLIASAALLSFAHGANDVANAIGPLAAIVHVAEVGTVDAKVHIPIWVMLVGGLGISFGLVFFGAKLIRMVGKQITKLNPMRAFCVALSAAITVIVASWLGLPVSSTHIAVGAVFGVGFFREWYTANSSRRANYVARKLELNRQNGNSKGTETPAPTVSQPEPAEASQARESAEIRRRKLVRRQHFMSIVAAWVITVPAATVLSMVLFFALRSMF
ncbi:inorganic phosphate transporter [Tepidamorphus sp. 3E244]|uniref:inorganic phosphate transporter n=1 Tax=Tepidamorphus sp. 3E244 TaxID=3385498 RepID=UPI0038FC66FC